MTFSESIKAWAEKVKRIKDTVKTEEATKHALVLPFLQLLGYNVFDPTEVVPEYTADLPGIKKNEKVDYAIFVDGQPIILIEVKSATEPLKKYSGQLARYFNATSAKFAVLTNGIQYWFFTDLEEPNKMDNRPFLMVDLENLKDMVISELEKFHKNNFDIPDILSCAEELKYLNEIQAYIEENFKSPTDDFVKPIIRRVCNKRATQQVMEKFKELTKKALHSFMNDKVNERIKSALEKDKIESEPQEEAESKSRIVTTEEELEAWALVKHLLKDELPEGHNITYKDTVEYFAITLDGNRNKWLCRLYLNYRNKYVKFPNDENKYSIDKGEDIVKFEGKLREILKGYLNRTLGFEEK